MMRTTDMDNHLQRVAVYCRVSTLLEHQEESFETQCAYYQRLMDSDPSLVLVDVYGDHGISGLSVQNRSEFQRMMGDCLDGKVDVVMTKSISRFARSLADCVDSVRLLKEKGIPVLFEKEGISSFDPSSELLFSLLAAMAQEESSSLSHNIRWAMERCNAKGEPWRRVAYGYEKERDCAGSRHQWQVYEPHAKRVRLAFELASESRCYADILRALQTMEDEEQTGITWRQERLYRLLRNEAYAGDILTHKTFSPDMFSGGCKKNTGQHTQYYIEAHHVPIVDRAVFEKVSELVRTGALQSPKGARRK